MFGEVSKTKADLGKSYFINTSGPKIISNCNGSSSILLVQIFGMISRHKHVKYYRQDLGDQLRVKKE